MFDLLQAFDDKSNFFLSKRTFYLACATCSELPSSISTMETSDGGARTILKNQVEHASTN